MQKLHPYINIYTEEEEEEVEIDRENLEQFYEWLKCDGLKPRKSERLWKKTILTNLLNDQKMTLDNFYDFLEYKQEQKMIKKDIDVNDDFDYTIVINRTITTDTGKHIVKRIIEADSQIHLFFQNGGDLLIPKIDIQTKFRKVI